MTLPEHGQDFTEIPQPRGQLEQIEALASSSPYDLTVADIDLLRYARPSLLYAGVGKALETNSKMRIVIGVAAAMIARDIEEDLIPSQHTNPSSKVYWDIAERALPGLRAPD